MERRQVRGAAAIALALTAAAVLTATAADPAAPAPAAPPPVPVHTDAPATVAAALDVVRGLWLEDAAAATAALDRLVPQTRVLEDDGDERYGSDPVAYSQAMRTTIDRTREALLQPDFEQAFNMFVWTQRSCMGCHAAVREAGLPAPTPTP